MVVDPVDGVEHLVGGEDHELVLQFAVDVGTHLRHRDRVDHPPRESLGQHLSDVAEGVLARGPEVEHADRNRLLPPKVIGIAISQRIDWSMGR